MLLDWFSFNPEAACGESEAVVLDVPVGIETREELFRAYHFGLGFPFYFGYNWDAFWDLMYSREHLEARLIIIRHHDIPMLNSIRMCQTYLEILIDLAIDQQSSPQNLHSKVTIVFPRFCSEKLEKLPHSQEWLDKWAWRLSEGVWGQTPF